MCILDASESIVRYYDGPRWALELGNTSFEPPGAGADDGIIVRGEFWMHRGHFLKEMKCVDLGQCPTTGH